MSILNLPYSGYKVESYIRNNQSTQKKFNISDGCIKVNDIYDKLLKLQTGEEFKANFVLYIVSMLIKSTIIVTISSMYLNLLKNFVAISSINWVEYVFSSL